MQHANWCKIHLNEKFETKKNYKYEKKWHEINDLNDVAFIDILCYENIDIGQTRHIYSFSI